MKVRVLRSAIDDLGRARKFYERQEAGLGDYFFDSLFAEIDSLALYGGVHAVHFGFHRMLAKRFPYAIYYKILDGQVVVFRVLDCRSIPNRFWGGSE
ncbi:type II toxin-antitoxin system RelE/ParE family toxin [Methylomonas sp. MO1]|uniref:type II toxin-antitoxin system RelE/ParE family toxin n=1 Tax=Methylomonas sp. MO1 TaxID=3073619 RepID=UPI0028A314B7|nr:type II toxin-antitoxin system RelE/ParE family toxin [Methylomonas sp. MO1]MDT4288839.1 type II toxin-antitoxin system RelE/ParE family toxin [Methylomonas sp. MO1]